MHYSYPYVKIPVYLIVLQYAPRNAKTGQSELIFPQINLSIFNRMKKILVVVLLVLLFVGGLIGLKTFVLNLPDTSPKDVVREYLDNINEGNSSDNAQYLLSSEEQTLNELQEERSHLVSVFVEERINADEATVV